MRSLLYTCTSCPFVNVTWPPRELITFLSNVALRRTACWTASEYPSSRCCAAYVKCTSMSWGGRKDALASSGVLTVFTTRPSRSSFGENLSDGSMRQLRILIAWSKLFVHDRGRSSHFVSFHPSSPSSGAHSLARMYNNSLFIPSTRPFTHGKYAATMCVFIPHLVQKFSTSSHLKCGPPSVIKVSDGAKL